MPQVDKNRILSASYEDDEEEEEEEQVDESQLTPEQLQARQQEQFLVHLVHASPALFDPSQRKSADRQRVLKELNMSQEQFEGWFRMLERDVLEGFMR